MPYYRLYHISQNHFSRVDDFEAEDDVRAVRRAASLNGTGPAELWSGKRKIKLLQPARNEAGQAEKLSLRG